jgi:hypothetical protein
MQKQIDSKVLLVVVLAVAAVVGLLVWGEHNRSQVAELRTQLADAEQKMTDMVAKAELETAQSRVEELEKKVADLESASAPAAETPDLPAVAAEATDQGKALLDMFASMTGKDQPAEPGQAMTNALSKMFEGEGGEQLARMTVNMYYGDFFQELNLPQETEQQVRDIIAKYTAEEITTGLKSLEEGPESSDIEGMSEEIEERLRDELSRILTADEMAIWQEYQDTMQERVLDQTYEMQLSMFAGGLTLENREIVKQTIIDEMLATDVDHTQIAAGPGDIEAAFDIQRAAYERARERLGDVLDEDQLAVFDQFVETQQQMLEMAIQMMGGVQEPEPEQ